MIHNVLCTFDLQLQTSDPDKPWQGFLASIAYAVCLKFHTTLQATPTELVFGYNMLLSCTHNANWEAICSKKQATIDKNRVTKNKKQKHHEYCVGDTILYFKIHNLYFRVGPAFIRLSAI